MQFPRAIFDDVVRLLLDEPFVTDRFYSTNRIEGFSNFDNIKSARNNAHATQIRERHQ